MRTLALSLAACLLGLPAATPLAPQESAEGEPTYRDEAARALHEAAMDARDRRDDSVVQYTALVRQRIGAALRMPLKDRTLYRAEAAHRVFWSREGQTVVQVLALREQTPLGVTLEATHSGLFDESFDPLNDRLFFGLVEPEEDITEPDPDDFWFEHPLLPQWRKGYTFAVGDTLTLSLPDGRALSAVELQVVPKVADVHRMTGSLWIDPESGALVRAVYRLSDTFDAFRDIPDLKEEEEEDLKFIPGLLKPWTFELSLIAVDYVLWDFDVWLPRSLRAEGVASAGFLKAPGAIDLSYEIEDVVTESDLAEVEAGGVEEVEFRTRREALAHLATLTGNGGVPYVVEPGWSSRRDSRGRRRVSYLVPEDPDYLRTSPDLPPPIWDDAPGFTSQDDLETMFEGLADLPQAPVQGMPATFRWGLQRSDLVRYNRVEELSVGARGQIRPHTPLGPLSLTLTARLGTGDLEPNARLDITRETLERRVTLSLFHELAAIDEGGRYLGLGNSVTAALFGRDDGEYYRRSGAHLEWTPPAAERASFRVRAYAEHHRAVVPETGFSLWHVADDAWAFRDNVVADEGWELGGLVTLTPWWGTDPRAPQGGLELTVQGAGGDFEYARASVETRLAVPLPADFRVGLEGGAGTSWGEPPSQRMWLMGGAGTLRGYGPNATSGGSYYRGRGELARQYAFGAVSLFGDLAWAGARDAVRIDHALASAGIGLSLVDGLIRIDAAWALRAPTGFRLEAYLDGIL